MLTCHLMDRSAGKAGAECPRSLYGLPPKMQRPWGGTFQLLPGRTSCAHLCAGSDRISLAFRAGPVLLGDNHRSERTLRFASCSQGEGSATGTRAPCWPRCPQFVPCRQERCPQADARLRARPTALLQPGKVSSNPTGPFPPSSSSSNVSRLRPRPGGTRHGQPTSAQRRAGTLCHRPAHRAGLLPLPSPQDSLPTAGTHSTAHVVFVVNNFSAEREGNIIIIIK